MKKKQGLIPDGYIRITGKYWTELYKEFDNENETFKIIDNLDLEHPIYIVRKSFMV